MFGLPMKYELPLWIAFFVLETILFGVWIEYAKSPDSEQGIGLLWMVFSVAAFAVFAVRFLSWYAAI